MDTKTTGVTKPKNTHKTKNTDFCKHNKSRGRHELNIEIDDGADGIFQDAHPTPTDN